MFERGAIRNPKIALQESDFRVLCWGKVTPTNLDGYVEFGGKLFCFFEGKHRGKEGPRGQILALERLVEAVHLPGSRVAVAFIVEHETDGVIDYGNLQVKKLKDGIGEWKSPESPVTLKAAIDAYREMVFGRKQ